MIQMDFQTDFRSDFLRHLDLKTVTQKVIPMETRSDFQKEILKEIPKLMVINLDFRLGSQMVTHWDFLKHLGLSSVIHSVTLMVIHLHLG